MSEAPVISLRGRIARVIGGGTIATLAVLLSHSGRCSRLSSAIGSSPSRCNHGLPNAGTRHSLACHDAGAIVRRAQSFDHRHSQLAGLTIAFVLTHTVPGSEGVAWIGWQVLAIASGFVVAALGRPRQRLRHRLGVSPILTTLGTMTLCKGLAIGLTHGNVISGFPDPIVFIGNGTVFGVPFALIVLALCALPVAIMLNATPFGAKVYMIGSNEKATRYSGVDTRAVLLKLYVLSSLLAGVAAVVMLARFNSANAAYGESYLLVRHHSPRCSAVSIPSAASARSVDSCWR